MGREREGEEEGKEGRTKYGHIIGGVGTSLEVQWLGLGALTAEGPGSIPGRGTKILHAPQCGQKKKKRVGVFWAGRHEGGPLNPEKGKDAVKASLAGQCPWCSGIVHLCDFFFQIP